MLTKYLPYVNASGQLLLGRLRKQLFPWYVNYTITNRCNLKCSYCYVDTNSADKRDPSLEEIIATIEGLYRLGTRYICLLGGEPLLRPDLNEIVTFISENKKGMLIAISTNGTHIDRHIHTFKKVNKLTVSLEGDKEEHDRDRGAGTYDKIVENMRLLREKGFGNVSIQATVSRSTITSWEHVVHLAKELGCSVLITEIASHPDEEFKEAALEQKQLLSLWSRVWELKRNGYPIENTYEAMSNIMKYSEYVGPYQIYYDYNQMPGPLRTFAKNNICPMGKYGAFLDTDGTFYPCASLFGTNGYNVHALSFEEAFTKMATSIPCKACRMSISCQLGYLFSSVSPFTLGKMALQALKNYNY